MARFQSDGLLSRLLMLLSLVVVFLAGLAYGCHPLSRKLHICLNTYLERDFPIVETILKGQQSSGFRRGRVLLEGPDLMNICRHIQVLKECYSELLSECDTYWQLERYQKLMKAMSATHIHLCKNSTNNVRDILLNGGCVTSAEDQIFGCSDIGISWVNTWKQILRMQVSASDKCWSLSEYKSCFLREMSKVPCGKDTIKPYGDLIDLWLNNWCSNSSITAPNFLLIPVLIMVVNALQRFS